MVDLKNLLILGGSGFIGSLLTKEASKYYNVTATYRTMRPFEQINVRWVQILLPSDERVIERIISMSKAAAVIDCIACSNPKLCETDSAQARYLNSELPQRVSQLCEEGDITLVYLSTEYVFDGERGGYSERDIPRPINHYGLTKLLGEQVALRMPRNLVIRTSMVYGWYPLCRFLNFILTGLKAGKPVPLYVDQFSCPTLVSDLVDGILRAVSAGLSGVYHMAGPDCVSRYQFGVAVASHLGFERALITQASSTAEDFRRPKNSCLSSLKAYRTLGMEFADLDQGLIAVARQARE